MTETEKKALALLNECAGQEVYGGWGTFDPNQSPCTRALCRAVEQHEAFRQEVSEAVERVFDECEEHIPFAPKQKLRSFIIPKTDPLVEVLQEISGEGGYDNFDHYAYRLRSALEARGFEVRKIGEGE